MNRYWPERVTFFLGAAIFAVLLFLGSTGHNPAKFTDPWMDGFGTILLIVGVKVLLPAWLVLRAFDVVFIAHRRNRF